MSQTVDFFKFPDKRQHLHKIRPCSNYAKQFGRFHTVLHLIINEFKYPFIYIGTIPEYPLPAVVFPSLARFSEQIRSRDLVHDLELSNMKMVIKRTGQGPHTVW